MFSFFKHRRRNKLLAADFSSEWQNLLTNNVWQYSLLDSNQRSRVDRCVKVMVAEKTWEGVDGFKVNDEIKVTISGAASLLTLGLPEPYFFDRARTIIIHPAVIQSRLLQQGHIVDPDVDFFAGQAWQGGPLIFSWPSVIDGSRESGNQHNVVIHEFAHHIDGLDGEMGGTPEMGTDELNRKWRAVLNREHAQMVDDIQSRRPTKINSYAGKNKAEFFAVTSEIFFDSPSFLKRQMPDVFECLQLFYKINPIAWSAY